jgi:AraC-like DNA-binding protein
VLPASIAIAVGFGLHRNEIDLLEFEGGKCFGYSDRDQGGASQAWCGLQSGVWTLRFQLRSGFSFPYAGSGMWFRESSQDSSIDIRHADSFVVEWRSRSQRSLRINLETIRPGITDPGRPMSYLPLEGALAIERDWSRHSISLADMTVPVWWYRANGAVPEAHPRALEHLAGIQVVTGFDSPPVIDDTVEIRKVTILTDRWWPMGAGLAVSLAISLLGWRLSLRAGASKATLARVTESVGSLHDVDLPSRADSEMRLSLDWLGRHYMEDNLTLERAAREIGIHPRRLTQLLKESGGPTFPGRINAMRLEQAMRLLVATDRTVSEIAVAVGIPNVQHFHRLFKARLGRTPLEWRGANRSGSGEQKL